MLQNTPLLTLHMDFEVQFSVSELPLGLEMRIEYSEAILSFRKIADTKKGVKIIPEWFLS
jgi:hypothetical protein